MSRARSLLVSRLHNLQWEEELSQYALEMIEQPCDHRSPELLRQIREVSRVAIAADQSVFNATDVFQALSIAASDLIVLGIHETGGIQSFQKAAAVAEAAGINICIHGLYETGITTCAANQAAAIVANLDDGNQYMNHLLESDILAAPDLKLREGRLPILKGPGLGFELDPDAVDQAEENHLLEIGSKFQQEN